MASNNPLIDLSGKKFERLTVIERAENSKWGDTRWRCLCNCGNETIVSSGKLKSGHTKSCGCLWKEKSKSGLIGLKEKDYAAKKHVYNSYRLAARRVKREFLLSFDDLVSITSMRCYYCGIEPLSIVSDKSKNYERSGNYPHNGIDRVDNTKGYTLENSVPCCWRCNKIKNNRTKEEILDFVISVYENMILKKGD